MMNPNENDLIRDEPLSTQVPPPAEEIASTGREQFRRATDKISTAMSQTWDETKDKATRARERTEYLVRENPVPAILTALGIRSPLGLRSVSRLRPNTKRSRGEVAAGRPELEHSFTAVSVAVV
jgi:ElaB/YqjD/DUF883 family membrane-anchored ribosome-binding protein